MINEIKVAFSDIYKWFVGRKPDYSTIGKIASDAHSKDPAYTLTQALTDHVITPLNLPYADDYDTEKPSLSAKAIWAASQSEYAMQLKLFEKHPLLGPRCNDFIAEQLTRTPLPLNQVTNEPIQITPKIKALAIKKALQNEAKAVGADISHLHLKSTESINEALQEIQQRRDNGLIVFFEHLREQIGSDTLNGLLAIEEQEPEEKARAIREWIPENQEALRRITHIELTARELRVIPHEICHFSQLQTLNLSHNQITSIPDSIGQLGQLQRLDLSHNQITSIPDSIGQLAQLQTLFLGLNRITSIPDSIGQLAQLRRLDLDHNQITSIPDSIGQLAQLQMLNLDHNQITSIPDSIGQLSQLQWLNLDHNQITSIPGSIGQLGKLEALDLDHNQITSIPDSIGQLGKLQMLNLDHNQITSIPDSIGQLGKLEALDLDHNQITSIPDSIGQLGKLEALDLQDNQITSIPESIGQLAQLQRLDLRSNPTNLTPEARRLLPHCSHII